MKNNGFILLIVLLSWGKSKHLANLGNLYRIWKFYDKIWLIDDYADPFVWDIVVYPNF